MTAVFDDAWVEVDGHRIHYLSAGEDHDATPVVLLHGGIIDAAALSWGGTIGSLAKDRPVYALDFAGYGESDDPDRTPTTEFHVDTLRGFVAALDLERPHLVGISMGGGVALGAVLDHPELAADLVLVSSHGLGRELPRGRATWLVSRIPALNRLNVALLRRSRRYASAGLEAIVHDPESLPPGLVDEFRRHLRRPNAGAAFRAWRAHEVTFSGWRTCYLDRFEEVGSPTLLIHGAHDDVVPARWSRRAAERIPTAEVDVFEDCAHWAPRERPERFDERVRAFLTD